MSRRNSGVYIPSRRQVPPISYETFEPKSEMKEQDGALLVLVHLPGFIKEQIRSTKDELTRHIRVYGERVLPNRRRIRFNTGFTIPQYYDLNKLKTNFEAGILTITIPKIPSLEQEPKQQPQEKDETKEIAASRTQEATSQKGQNEIDKKDVIKDDNKEKISDKTEVKKTLMEKEIIPKEEGSKQAMDLGLKNIVEDDNKEKISEKNEVEKTLMKEEKTPKKEEVSEKATDVGLKDVVKDDNKEKIIQKNGSPNEVEKTLIKQEIISNQNSIRREEVSNKGMDVGKENIGSASDSSDRKGVDDERQLMVNTLVAILVIVTIGANIFYTTFSSSKKA
ncbi:hypothetical protein JCGZ_12835 [Jatropha curcas]|uniref:SHSP domain-containing protein n=1 Tax=Jatropha curcas TaxID=180498 RepID=A0A067KDI8_JATCU|nr:hypothetical protein JCGZ_12835 [Jatropha curcas]